MLTLLPKQVQLDLHLFGARALSLVLFWAFLLENTHLPPWMWYGLLAWGHKIIQTTKPESWLDLWLPRVGGMGSVSSSDPLGWYAKPERDESHVALWAIAPLVARAPLVLALLPSPLLLIMLRAAAQTKNFRHRFYCTKIKITPKKDQRAGKRAVLERGKHGLYWFNFICLRQFVWHNWNMRPDMWNSS